MKILSIMHPGMSTARIVLDHKLVATGSSPLSPIPPHLHVLSSHKAWLLGLILLSGLSGCGPAQSDPEQNLASRASQVAPPESPVTSPRTPSSLSNQATMAPIEAPSPLPDKLLLPIWMAQALDAPDVSVRLRALDKWATLGADASLDPLVVALDDDNDEVRMKAMELIEQHWAIEAQTEPEIEQHRDTDTALP
jgi:hypothetical protein